KLPGPPCRRNYHEDDTDRQPGESESYSNPVVWPYVPKTL
ncbi:uncharacterized protein METZ01_LOCUS280201, partial [marine metagenome]